MVPHEGEPAAGPWQVVPLTDLAGLLLGDSPVDRPAVVAVGGRSSSGKTTMAERLATVIPGSVVVHTDDIAWRHAVLDWDDLLRTGVLEPTRRGQPVAYRPPKWDEYGRPGAVVVPAGARALIVEGVGATRRTLAPLLDATVWVQADAAELDRRNEARIAVGEITSADHRAWMAEEEPFLLGDRAWERASVIVAGTPELPHDPETEAVAADFAPRAVRYAVEELADSNRQLGTVSQVAPRAEYGSARKGKGPGDDAGVGGPAGSRCGHVDRLIT
jgi:hypothetical protein